MRPDGAAAAGAAGVAVAADRIDAIARVYIEYLVSKAAVLLTAEMRKKLPKKKSAYWRFHTVNSGWGQGLNKGISFEMLSLNGSLSTYLEQRQHLIYARGNASAMVRGQR